MILHASSVAKYVAATAVAAAIAQAQAATQSPGFLADPAVALFLRLLNIVLGLLLSGTIIVACIKMIAYFGAAGATQKRLEVSVKEAAQKFETFTDRVDRTLLQLTTGLVEVKTKANGDHEDHERRLMELERRHYRRRAADRVDEDEER